MPNIQKLEKKQKIKGLLKALNHKKSEVRYEALKALGNIENPIAVKDIILTLNDNDSCVQEEAIISLGKIGDEKAIYPLIKKLDNNSFKDLIIDILSKFNHIIVIKHLINELDNPYLWKVVLETLKLFGAESFDQLVQELSTNDPMLRISITKVLGYLGDMRAVDLLIRLFRDSNYNVRLEATKSLDILGWEPKNDLNKIEYLFIKEQWNELVTIGSLALDILISALKNTKQSIRENACRSLGEIGDSRAIKPLVELLRDERQEMRLEAINALEKLGWEPRNEQEQWDALIIREQWTQLVTIGSPVVPRLIEVLNDRDFKIRKNAVWALGEIKDPKVIPPLVKVLNNPRSGNQKDAAKALKNHGWCPSKDIKGVWEARLRYNINECWRKAIPASSNVAIASNDEKIFILPDHRRELLQVMNYEGIQVSEFKTNKAPLKVSPDGDRILVGRILYDSLGKKLKKYGNKNGIFDCSYNVDIFAGINDGEARIWNLKGKKIYHYIPYKHNVPSGYSVDGIERQNIAISPDGSFQVAYVKAEASQPSSSSGARKGLLYGGLIGAAIGAAVKPKRSGGRKDVTTYGIWMHGQYNSFSTIPPSISEQIYISNANIIVYSLKKFFIYDHYGHLIGKSSHIDNVNSINPRLDGKVIFCRKKGSIFVFDINSKIETKIENITNGKAFAINKNGDKLAVIENKAIGARIDEILANNKGTEEALVLYDLDLSWEMEIL